ncbi:MAG: hypothetical protein EBU82_06585 [Flavobacteriia bacterium]|jgi:antitoxin component YwqK of YwqJK toxin-antitoxin module|nr:hypothetical protein [Flavobacteriia bacterium]NBP29087.1 hypothetical protein [Flavobacteriia bacterium]
MKMRLIILWFLFGSWAAALSQNKTDAAGRKQGAWIKYQSDGTTPLYTGNFKDDIPVGEFIYYYPNGKVKSIVQHETKYRTYVWFYFENEAIMSEGQYLNMQKDSLWKTYNTQGFLVSTEYYKNNRLNGEKSIYYLQNQLERGELKIAQLDTYKDSVLHGPHTAYFSSGKMKENGRYENGLKVGIWETYHPEGTVASRLKYRKGKAYGYCIAYDENGTELYRSYWLDGKSLKGEDLKKYFQQCEKNGVTPEE